MVLDKWRQIGRAAFTTYLKEGLISCFILLNLSTILFMNRPLWMIRGISSLADRFSPQTAYHINYATWLVQRYAHLAGLDNRWQMFGSQPRFNWWLVFQGAYANGKTIDLPLPLQSHRTPVQALFLDIKEGKYQLNLYPPNTFLRERYAHYLCREYLELDGSPIRHVIVYLNYRNLLEPPAAAAQGTHFAGPVYTQTLDTFSCP